MELDIFIEVLEASVKKNGEKPLTNQYLLNILKMVEKKIDRIEERDQYDFEPDIN